MYSIKLSVLKSFFLLFKYDFFFLFSLIKVKDRFKKNDN